MPCPSALPVLKVRMKGEDFAHSCPRCGARSKLAPVPLGRPNTELSHSAWLPRCMACLCRGALRLKLHHANVRCTPLTLPADFQAALHGGHELTADDACHAALGAQKGHSRPASVAPAPLPTARQGELRRHRRRREAALQHREDCWVLQDGQSERSKEPPRDLLKRRF